MKKLRNKRGVILLTVICMLAAALAGCGSKLSDEFDEGEVESAAQTMVKQIHDGELETVYNDTFAPIMYQGVTLEQLQTNVDYILERVGEYQSIEKVAVAGSTDKDTEQEYAVAVVVAKYEKGKVQFTISFDTNMKCVGFYMK